ncbi:HAD hydrolase subfamily IA REG-2-like protein [Hysterangium stoloniferum]|nr:HAD hydrolase subfamily IA REG-2-like protein [Hysterangium stoloniferum]
MPNRIKLVLFDALHTLITPRLPVHIQYAQVFEPYIGPLPPDQVKTSFKKALKDMQREKPAYAGGAQGWWKLVIRRTAVGAGADEQRVDSSLDIMVPALLQRFSGQEGYKTFNDAVPTLEGLLSIGMKTGLVSNADSRMRSVIIDLNLSTYLDPLLLSEEEGIEKPAKEIWERACSKAGVGTHETLYVGDELECDYHGARQAGLHALLLRRPGPERVGEQREADEDLSNIQTVQSLSDVVTWMRQRDV